MEPGLLSLLPTEIFFLAFFLYGFEILRASLLRLLSYLANLVSAPFVIVFFVLSFLIQLVFIVIVCLRFIILLPFSILLPISFLCYFCLYFTLKWTISSLYLVFSLFLTLFSKFYVVRRPRFRQGAMSKCSQGCKRERESELCSTCRTLVDSSALLTGTWRLFTRPIEMHPHLKNYDLMISSRSCALCSLLQHSKLAIDDAASRSHWQDGSRGAVEAAGTIHMIKIWEEAHIREGPILRIQLVDNEPGYKALGLPLAVGEVKKRM